MPGRIIVGHASVIWLDVADTLSDTLFRDHAQCSADGIAVPMPGLKTTRPSTDTRELTGDELKNRNADRAEDDGLPVPTPADATGAPS